MNIVDACMLVAMKAHGGDRNKHDGELYILHPARVSVLVREAGGTDVQIAIAWLHDTLEDTILNPYSIGREIEDLWRGDASTVSQVVSGVMAMTKDPEAGENADYIQQVKRNADALFVKQNGDIVDNLRRNHLILLEPKRLKMMTKYSKMLAELTA